ncbi:MAG: ABC transporter substrate-binding protein [Solirubrobacterales bacterium]|nr:ABC transporter substrate-binding protein [Solirubrobacterales bacterium]
MSSDERQRRADAIRYRIGDVENDLYDELRAGRIDRREFVRRGAVLGLSLSTLGVLAGCAQPNVAQVSPPQTKPPRPGGTIRAGIVAPAAALDPIMVSDEGGLAVLGQTGQYLAWSDKNLTLRPVLAESWSHDATGKVWTFKIRRGVKFSDGSDMSAADVAATFNRLADPAVGSNALSTFAGVLSKGNVTAVDPYTAQFKLDFPNGNFPYLVSSDNYNAIVLPKSYSGGWDKTFIGTGPWKLHSFTPNQGVTYVPNPVYWGPKTVADRSELTFYPEEQAQTLGIQGNQVDVLSHYSVSGGRALITDPNIRTTQFRSSSHREIHMRNDKEPFTDPRVRQAVALLVDRRGLVDGLLATKSDYGNDSPFAPLFRSTNPSVPQRQQNVAKAKQLLEAAGKSGGFSTQLTTLTHFELPDLAQVVQNDVSVAGINLSINILDPGTYYGSSKFGTSPWLDSTMGITDYGHRGVPNLILTAPLTTNGPWNAAHFHNPQYDKLVAQYVAALDLGAQRAAARQIQELLLAESPVLFPYFYYFLTAARLNVSGVETTAMGHIDVSRAGFVA